MIEQSQEPQTGITPHQPGEVTAATWMSPEERRAQLDTYNLEAQAKKLGDNRTKEVIKMYLTAALSPEGSQAMTKMVYALVPEERVYLQGLVAKGWDQKIEDFLNSPEGQAVSRVQSGTATTSTAEMAVVRNQQIQQQLADMKGQNLQAIIEAEGGSQRRNQ